MSDKHCAYLIHIMWQIAVSPVGPWLANNPRADYSICIIKDMLKILLPLSHQARTMSALSMGDDIVIHVNNIWFIFSNINNKGGSRNGAPPGLKYFWGFVFVNINSETRIYFDFSQNTMFIICILFTTLTTKT